MASVFAEDSIALCDIEERATLLNSTCTNILDFIPPYKENLKSKLV